jgi:hypothetical protein
MDQLVAYGAGFFAGFALGMFVYLKVNMPVLADL